MTTTHVAANLTELASDPPSEPPEDPTPRVPAPIPPSPNGSSLWRRAQAWLMA